MWRLAFQAAVPLHTWYVPVCDLPSFESNNNKRVNMATIFLFVVLFFISKNLICYTKFLIFCDLIFD
jgi:hypothetical protein